MKHKWLIGFILLSIIAVFLILVPNSKFLFPLFSTEPVLTKTEEKSTIELEKEKETAENITTEKETVINSVETESETVPHQHFWLISSYSAPFCEKDGLRVLSCKCGEKVEEIIPALTHEYEGGSCKTESKCKHCGLKGKKFDHAFDEGACIDCGYEIKAPIYALGKAFDFDEGEDSILAKLGNPIEVLTEGSIRSLVYATSSKLTIFQLDFEGLWGVFTMDPNAFFRVEDNIITYSNFVGKEDVNSDAVYQNVGVYKIFGFRDSYDQNACYGLWIHYSDFTYHYAGDPEIYEDYRAQNRISFYYVNALRSKKGLVPLSWSEAAAQVSLNYAQKMANEKFFAHDYKCGERLTQAGVVWRSCGENLSQGYVNAFFVMDAYFNSKDHRSNILGDEFTRLGVGFFRTTDESGSASVMGAQTYFS